MLAKTEQNVSISIYLFKELKEYILYSRNVNFKTRIRCCSSCSKSSFLLRIPSRVLLFLYAGKLFMQFFWCAGNEICPSRYIYILQRSACVLCDVCIARRDSRRRPSSLPPHFGTLLPHLDRMFPFISIHFEDSLSSYITRTRSYLITSSRFGVDHYLIGNARPVMYD